MRTSEARTLAARLAQHVEEGLPIVHLPAPCGVSHADYKVGYFADNSILIWARGEGLLVLDELRTYYRDTVEHLARCLGLFTKARRAELLKGEEQWVSGVKWAAEGSFLEID